MKSDEFVQSFILPYMSVVYGLAIHHWKAEIQGFLMAYGTIL